MSYPDDETSPTDPNDIQGSGAQPVPSPSPQGSNPFSPSPSTSPVATSTPSGNAPANVDPTKPPADFVKWVNTAMSGRLGQTKYALIPSADKTALINKIWADPSVQNYYQNNYSNFSSKDPQISSSAAAGIGNLINSVMMGQGNDPTTAVDYTNMLQVAGVPLTTAEQSALSGATQAVNAPIPRPFGTNVVSGYDFGAPMPPGGWSSKAPGQSYGWQTHNGVDYGTKAGDRIVAPFAGTVTVENNVPGYGNYVTITLDDGYKMGFGHVAAGYANGQRVNPGDLIATAGANVGSAEGSVTMVTWQKPDGSYANPHDVLDPIFSGTTFSAIGNPGAAGTGMPTVNKVLDAEYPSIKSDWVTYFGSPPSPEDVMNVLQHGASPAQWSDYIRALPSHIDGLNQGQYYDMRQQADQVSTSVLGHPSTDSIVAELAQQQLTSKTAITNWYNEHGVTGIDTSTYNDIYKAIQPTMNAVFGEPSGADPRTIKNIYDTQAPYAPAAPAVQAERPVGSRTEAK
jgi:murein DD-endopeptidase MepM/ murein hydrolase activator NlpD